MRNEALYKEIDSLARKDVNYLDNSSEYFSLLYRMKTQMQNMEKLLQENGIVYQYSKDQAMVKLAKGEEVAKL